MQELWILLPKWSPACWLASVWMPCDFQGLGAILDCLTTRLDFMCGPQDRTHFTYPWLLDSLIIIIVRCWSNSPFGITRRLRTRNTTARDTIPLHMFSSRVASGFLKKKINKTNKNKKIVKKLLIPGGRGVGATLHWNFLEQNYNTSIKPTYCVGKPITKEGNCTPCTSSGQLNWQNLNYLSW